MDARPDGLEKEATGHVWADENCFLPFWGSVCVCVCAHVQVHDCLHGDFKDFRLNHRFEALRWFQIDSHVRRFLYVGYHVSPFNEALYDMLGYQWWCPVQYWSTCDSWTFSPISSLFSGKGLREEPDTFCPFTMAMPRTSPQDFGAILAFWAFLNILNRLDFSRPTKLKQTNAWTTDKTKQMTGIDRVWIVSVLEFTTCI